MKKTSLFLAAILLVTLTGCSTPDVKKDSNSNNFEKITDLETDNKNDSNTEKFANNNISVVSAECSWAIDVTDPLVVMKNSDYFLRVRVRTKEKTKYFIKNSIMPSSVYNLEVLEVIKNNNNAERIPKNIKLVVNGGVVTKQEYANSLDKEAQEKAAVDKMSNKELTQKILIKDESYYELQQGQEYYIFVCDITDDENYKGYYCMREGGYDVFTENNGMYVNVLTSLEVFLK